jgi:peptidoglycan/LPS O-acetylase OafA/YrhL
MPARNTPGEHHDPAVNFLYDLDCDGFNRTRIKSAGSRAMSQPPSHEEFLSRRYFSSLDIFRCWSIVAVIWHHSQKGVAWFPASDRGFLGVDFFFVISGFLIVTLLLREREREGEISLRRFYLRRALRIFPIYYAMLGAMTLVLLFIKPHARMAPAFFEELPYQAFYLSNLAKNTTILVFTWSLATEEQFYVFWPPIERWLRKAAIPLLLLVIAVNQCINFGLIRTFHHVFGEDQAIFQVTFTPICLGVLVAHLLHWRPGFDWMSSWLGARWSSLVMLGVLLLACNVPIPDLMGWPRLVIQLSMALLLVSCVVREDHRLGDLLGWRAARRIGVVSYGMYLFHMFVVVFVGTMLGRAATLPLVGFLLSVALTIVVAELSFRFYETPFLRLKDVLGRGSRPARAREPGEARVAGTRRGGDPAAVPVASETPI